MIDTVIAVCFAAALCFGFAAVRNRKPGLPLSPSRFSSPLNYLFDGDVFTARGDKFRILALLSGAVAIACMILQQVVG